MVIPKNTIPFLVTWYFPGKPRRGIENEGGHTHQQSDNKD